VSRNVAARNSALGIESVPGVIDGGGNLPFGNGDPRHCPTVACHWRLPPTAMGDDR
jgi:hypothetical protein